MMLELLWDKTRNKTAIVAGFVFLTLTCLYRWTNLMVFHDSLMVVRNDVKWQISLGRFLNHVYLAIRGQVMPPLFAGVVGGLFLIVAVVLCVHILGIKRRSSVILCAGLLTSFETLAYVNASFILSFEIDMLALLYACFAAWLLTRAKNWLRFPFAVLFIVCSLAHFQSYIEVAIVLVMLALYRDLLEGKKPSDVVRAGVGAVLTFLIAGLCYYVALRVVWRITDVPSASSYNSLRNMNQIVISSVPSLLIRTWKFFILYLLKPSTTNMRFAGALQFLLGVYIVAQTAFLIRKRRLGRQSVALLALLLVLFPLGCNCVYFLSNELKNCLMTYSFVFFDVWALMLFDVARTRADSPTEPSEPSEPTQRSVPETSIVSDSKLWLKRYVVPAMCVILILNRILFANTLYQKIDLLNRATLSFMTRMVDRMEQTPGYKIGETPVLILGNLAQNPWALPLKNFNRLNDGLLYDARLAVTFPETFRDYFDYVLAYPVNLVPRNKMMETLENLDSETVQNMPIFPEQGGVALIDGVLVVRLSEQLDHPINVPWMKGALGIRFP